MAYDGGVVGCERVVGCWWVVECERVVGWERRWTLAGKQDGVVERWRNDNGGGSMVELNQNKES